jgi:hypothetical protein
MNRLLLFTLYAGFTFPLAGSIAGATGGPPQTYSVTIEDTLTNGAPTAIRSDGLGPYTNGVDGVSVSLGVINFWPRNDRGTRNVVFNNGGEDTSLRPYLPSPNDAKAPPTGMTGTDNLLKDPHTGNSNPSQSPIQNMTIGSSQCITFFWAVKDSSTGYGWRAPNFHGNLANVPQSSYAVVTRDSATQWTIESNHSGLCTDNPYNVGMVLHDESTTMKGKTITTTYADGFYYVPFRLTYLQQ